MFTRQRPRLHSLARGVAALLLSLCAVAPVEAGCSKTIRSAYPASFSKLSIGQAGTVHEIQGRIAAASGCRIEWVDLPQARSLNEFYNGNVDIFWGLQSLERDRYGTFAGDGPAGKWVLISLAAAQGIPSQLADFIGHRNLLIGAIRGLAIPADLNADVESLRGGGQWDESVDDDMAVAKLVHGRDAALLMVSVVADLLVARHKEIDLRLVEQKAYAPPMGGAYISKRSLAPADQQVLIKAINSLVPAISVVHPPR